MPDRVSPAAARKGGWWLLPEANTGDKGLIKNLFPH